MRLAFSIAALIALAACSDPLESIEKLSDIDLQTDQSVSALPTEQELSRDGSVISDLWNQSRDEDTVQPQGVETPSDANAQDATKVAAFEPNATSGPDQTKQRGVVGWLARLAATSDRVESDELGATSQSARTARRNGNPEVRDVPFGTVLAFGEVARVCEARAKPLGQRIATSETRGQVYKIFDTAADSAAPRTFYVTGFSDACPRQFTAALALFGDVGMHEQLRYGQPSTEYPYSVTDEAYEKIKSRICRVGKGKPCGKRLENLSRSTVFVSVYENFADNGQWADILLHDGAVVATAMKAP